MATFDVGDDVLGDDLTGDDALAALLGDDLTGDDVLGAARRLARRGRGRGQPTLAAPNLFQRPGMAPPSKGKLPLGFGSLTCAAGSTGGTLTARPQVPWLGRKLIISIAGTNAGDYGVTVRPTIGNRPVLAGGSPIDARSFPANGLDNDLLAEAAGPGVDVSLEFVVTPVVGAGHTVIIAPSWIGEATV